MKSHKVYGSNQNNTNTNVRMSEQITAVHRVRHPFNYLNFLNVLGYAANFVVVFGAGSWFAKNLPDIGTVSIDYQPLIEPAGWAFAIWSVIFLAEAIFTVAQLLPSYRAHPLVQNGVGIWFFLANIFQALWVFAFLLEYIYASMIAMAFIEISLIFIVASQQYESSLYVDVQHNRDIWKDFWLIRFPFEIHCGWITVATILNANIVVVAANTTPAFQLAASILSLAIIMMAMVVVLFVPNKRPRYTIALVFAWATFALQYGMRDPDDSVKALFDKVIIKSIEYAATAIYQFILATILIKYLSGFCCKGRKNEPQINIEDLLLDEEVPLLVGPDR